MDENSARIATICQCIEQCFSYLIFISEFPPLLTEEDKLMGAARDIDLISNSTMLISSLSLRKIDDFFIANGWKDDLKAPHFNIDIRKVLEAENFLDEKNERDQINKCVAHLTVQLNLDIEFEVDLHAILSRSIPTFHRLIKSLRDADASGEAEHFLNQTETTLNRVVKWLEPKINGEPLTTNV